MTASSLRPTSPTAHLAGSAASVPWLDVDVRLEQRVKMLNACRRNLRCNHREARAATGEGADVFRIEHGAGLDFIA